MDSFDEVNLESFGFDVDNPDQYQFSPATGSVLRVVCLRARSLMLNAAMVKFRARGLVFFVPQRPDIVMLEWHLTDEQTEQARQMLKRYKLRSRDNIH